MSGKFSIPDIFLKRIERVSPFPIHDILRDRSIKFRKLHSRCASSVYSYSKIPYVKQHNNIQLKSH